jgi:hypothetical protein
MLLEEQRLVDEIMVYLEARYPMVMDRTRRLGAVTNRIRAREGRCETCSRRATASREEPQYLIESDKTDHLAVHKGSALRKIGGPAGTRAPSRSRRTRRSTGS